ncbi:transmembrane ascorbate-dependent reductase CYB561-like isoform X2 [Dermatophagoides pteronyssinus]|uniref:transmembrane ascorbate-dependent reductase CYB561-like isoform X2 n=1 Tax=Dermatophagoides pteronyssinus TaxID=6956 RepID=UPI003F670F1E
MTIEREQDTMDNNTDDNQPCSSSILIRRKSNQSIKSSPQRSAVGVVSNVPTSSALSSKTTTRRYRHLEEDRHLDTNELESIETSAITDRSPLIMSDAMESPKTSSPGHDGLALVNRRHYDRVYYFSQLLALFIFILVLIWLIEHLGGIGFSSPAQTFNFHPLFMVLGFIIIYSNSMLIYRSFRMELKHKLKLFHTIMNGSVMFISFFGSIAAVYFHQKASITHFYSLHSWLGISTWLMFVTQFCSGFVAFLFPGASFSLRKMMMPYHRYFGIATFALASATCLTGINEKAIFAFKNPSYSSMAWNGILTNMIGLLLCLYGGTIIYLVTKPEYQRRPLPEEMTGPNRRSSISYSATH